MLWNKHWISEQPMQRYASWQKQHPLFASKMGNWNNAIPGQEIGATLRILADGAWGVHSTTDISNIPNEIDSTVKLARAVAARRQAVLNPLG
jgi:hypothetical protein